MLKTPSVRPEVLFERAISKSAVERVANPHGLRTHDTKSPLPPTTSAKSERGAMNRRRLIPLARMTIISESPHRRAKASMTPRRVDMGSAISRKVGMIATNTVPICPNSTPRFTIREVSRNIRMVRRSPVNVSRLIAKNEEISFSTYRERIFTISK